MNNPPPIFITSTMVFIAYSTIISMLRGLSRIGFRVLSDGFRSIRFSSIFSDTLRYIGWRGTSESGSNEKKERKKGFDTSPTWIGRKKIFFHRWISFKAFRSRSRKEGREKKNERYEREFGRKMRAGQVRWKRLFENWKRVREMEEL